MRALEARQQFDRDLKRAKRRGKTLDKLWEIVELLIRGGAAAVSLRVSQTVGPMGPALGMSYRAGLASDMGRSRADADPRPYGISCRPFRMSPTLLVASLVALG